MTALDIIDLLPVRVPLDRADMEGALVFRNGHVVAMLVRLAGADYGVEPGRWKVQATFGLQSFDAPPLFDSLGKAARWFSNPLNEALPEGLSVRCASLAGVDHSMSPTRRG